MPWCRCRSSSTCGSRSGSWASACRVLRPGGALLLSTPNRLTFSPGRDTPLNPFHTRELSAAELAGLVADAGFVDVAVLGLHHGRGCARSTRAHGGSLVAAQTTVALAGSRGPTPCCATSPSVTTADFALDADDVDACLDLVALARRPSPG